MKEVCFVCMVEVCRWYGKDGQCCNDAEHVSIEYIDGRAECTSYWPKDGLIIDIPEQRIQQ